MPSFPKPDLKPRPRPFPRPGPGPFPPPPLSVLPSRPRTLVAAIGGTEESARDQISAPRTFHGHGDPNGVITGNQGDLYLNLDGGGGNTLWVKEFGNDNSTGWNPK